MVEIINQTKQSLDLKRLKQYCALLAKKTIDFEVVFVAEKYMRELNNRYRGIDKATDILTFDLGEIKQISQIFICPAVAKENAKKFNKTLEEEMELLILHGSNHLIGKHHE